MTALAHLSPRHHPLASIPISAVLAVVAVTVPMVVILGGEARLAAAAVAAVAGVSALALVDLRWEGADMIRLFGVAGVLLAVPAALLALVPVDPFDETRLAGDNRLATATAVSGHLYESADAVVVVAPDSATDALAATPLAMSAEGPLLFAGTGLAEEVERLGATRAYLVGGLAGNELLGALLQTAGVKELVPLAGNDRHGTAAAVASHLRPDRLFVSATWADAIAVSPLLEGAALLSVERGAVPAATAQALTRLRPSEIVVVGGEGAVQASVEQRLRTLAPDATVRRLAGENRWATSLLALEAHEGSLDRVWVGSGDSWPDAVVAGAGAAATGEPLLLVPSDRAAETVTNRWIQDHEDDLEQLTIVGGEAAVPPLR